MIDIPKKTEVPIMLTCGKYTYQLDNKNRLRLPSKVRDDYGDELYLSIDMRGSLLVRSKESMEEIFRKLEQVSMSDWETQDAIMDFSSMTFSVKLDDQRRFMLPAELKNYAKIDKNIVVVGLPRGGRYGLRSHTKTGTSLTKILWILRRE